MDLGQVAAMYGMKLGNLITEIYPEDVTFVYGSRWVYDVYKNWHDRTQTPLAKELR